MERLLLYETAVHFLDTFRFLGGEFTSIFCQTNRINPAIRGEDYALIQVSFSSGAKGLIDANRISGAYPPPIAFGEFRIEGERAMIRIAAGWELFTDASIGQPEILHRPRECRRRATRATASRRCRSISRSVCCPVKRRSRKAPQYLKTVQAVDACYRSAQTGIAGELRMRTLRIAVLAGDGIGPEVIAEGVRVLRAVEELHPRRPLRTSGILGRRGGVSCAAAIRCRRQRCGGSVNATRCCSERWDCPTCGGRMASRWRRNWICASISIYTRASGRFSSSMRTTRR